MRRFLDHVPEYAMEAALLGLFMKKACSATPGVRKVWVSLPGARIRAS